MTNEELNSALYKKLSNEIDQYKSELFSMPAEEILKCAYAYAMKEDIVFAMEELNLSDKQCKALLSEQNALDKIFSHWENHESRYMDDIRDMIECTANEKIRDNFVRSKCESR